MTRKVRYESETGNITMTLAGEAMITRALSPYREEQFLHLRELFRASQVGFANCEMLFHDYENWPTYLSQTYMRCDPRFIRDLQWLGINLVSCANNHGYDYGENGVVTHLKNLDAAGLAHAGSGRNAAEASAPAYLDTPSGRVALVSATSSGRPNSRAGEQRPDMSGRPGVNLIRWVNEWTVDGDAFAALQRIARGLGWRQRMPSWWNEGYGFRDASLADVVYLPDRNSLGVGSEDLAARFVRGQTFERHTRLFRPDAERNVQRVREARRMADWVVYSIHAHEGGSDGDEPAEHIVELAHAVIDAGADVVLGHGPHRDRGIELFKGKPILYGLGNFIMQNDTVERMPQDSMALWGLGLDATAADLFDARSASRPREESPGPGWWSAVATVTFQAGALHDLRLHPIELGFGLPRSQAGRPVLAGPEIAGQALERFRRLSEPFATVIDIQDCVGVVRNGNEFDKPTRRAKKARNENALGD